MFYRDRTKVGEKEKPRFMPVVGAGVDLQVFAKHIRKSELEATADAELVFPPRGAGPAGRDEDVEVEE